MHQRKDIKNLHLAVYPPDGRVRIATPLNINDEAVRLFAISKLAWIKNHQANFETQERQSKREFVSGESHYFQGKRYLLNVIYCQGNPKIEIRNNTYIDLYVREGSNEAQRKQVMMSWYRRQLKQDIPPLIEKWEKNIGVKVDEWGNLELVKKDKHCLEYVVVHEMVHLLERNHGDRFVALMNQFIPNWRFLKDELNRSVLGSY